MKGTTLLNDDDLSSDLQERLVGCSTRSAISNLARMMIWAIDDEVHSDLIPMARKKRMLKLRDELEKVFNEPGARSHLVRFSSQSFRDLRQEDRLPTAEIFQFSKS